MKKSNKQITSSEFDQLFEDNDVTAFLDRKNVKVNRKMRRINIDIPTVLLGAIDKEANKIGVARTALIKLWLAEKTQLMRK